MQIFDSLARLLRFLLIGRGLKEAATRNREAADRLDATLREVLRK